MHLLRRLAVRPSRCFDGPASRLLVRRRLSNGGPSSAAATAAAASDKGPRGWALLNKLVRRRDGDDPVVADAGTTAEARTSTGRHLRVSLGRAEPPASSFLYYGWAGGGGAAPGDEEEEEKEKEKSPEIVAAHGDAVLLEVAQRQHGRRAYDYLVYVAGAGAGRPPSLSLLPAGEREPHEPLMNGRSIVLLRRGEDGDLLVAQLCSAFRGRDKDLAELRVCRLGGGGGGGGGRAVVRIVDGVDGDLDWSWHSYTAVPVGERFMCWADYNKGVLVCDMADLEAGRPRLRHARMPEVDDDPEWEHGDRADGCGGDWLYTWNMGAAGAAALRYVTVDPRCCCGHSPTRSSCPHGGDLFAVTTWTLDLTPAAAADDDGDGEPAAMAWVKEGTLDCDELWELPGYEGLPRVAPEWPVVSAADADVVCFMVRGGVPRETWMVEVDTRKKELLSVAPWTNVDVPREATLVHVPAKLHG
ncbi:hypothetical protein ACP4OV_014706 [Aristida adscensionis]